MLKFWLSVCLIGFSSLVIAEQQTWYLVRHFEKQTGPDPSLTKTGHKRAEALARFFADKPLAGIYSTDYQRTQQTANPVAKIKSLTVQSYNPSDLAAFAKQLAVLDQVLVVGHSNTTPELLALMGGENVSITESDYGTLYILHKQGNTYQTQTQPITTD